MMNINMTQETDEFGQKIEEIILILETATRNIYLILNTVADGYMNVTDERLNSMYINMVEVLKDILDFEELSYLKETLPADLPESLFERFEDTNVWWFEEEGRKNMLKFIGAVMVEKNKNGKNGIELPDQYKTANEEIKEQVEEHKKMKDAAWKRGRPKLDKIREEIFKTRKNNSATKKPKDLSKSKITFNQSSATIYVDEIEIKLPPYKKEHLLCSYMFELETHDPVDWSEVYEDVFNEIGKADDRELKRLYDTTTRINVRIRKETGAKGKLLLWRNKTITRQY